MKGLATATLLLVALTTAIDAHRPQPPRQRQWIRSLQRDEDKLTVEDTTDADDESGNDDGITTSQSAPRGSADWVLLVPFEVQIAVVENNGIETNEIFNIVTAWLNEAYSTNLESFGYTEANRYAKFNSVVLFKEDDRDRALQSGGELYTQKFQGATVFSRDEVRTKSVPENDILFIQEVTLNDDAGLRDLLRESSEPGLGSDVVDVNAFLNAVSDNTTNSATAPDDNLELVIVIAIVVACIAFLCLLGAVFWAYNYDRANRLAYLAKEHGGPDRTDVDTAYDETPEKIRPVHVERSHLSYNNPHLNNSNSNMGYPHAYPTMIGGDDGDNNYPDSVISDSIISGSVLSEDVSTSLSQYYRAGMGKVGISSSEFGRRAGLLDDAGSVSSMESYGYSLDGGAHGVTLPSDVAYQKDRDQYGGLPVEPVNVGDTYDMDDVQIPDLDKELANLDIKLTPNMEHVDDETFSQQDMHDHERKEDTAVVKDNKDAQEESSAAKKASLYDHAGPERAPPVNNGAAAVVESSDDEDCYSLGVGESLQELS